jgi:hypothetical protein
VGDGRKLLDSAETANPLQVHVNESVGAGEEAGGFRGSVAAQFDDNRHSRDYGQNSNNRGEPTACPYAHGRVAGPLFLGDLATASPTTPQNGDMIAPGRQQAVREV